MENRNIKEGRYYTCIEDWHKLGSSFTEGKTYKCHKTGCIRDDHGAEKVCVGQLFRRATKEEINSYKRIIKGKTVASVINMHLKNLFVEHGLNGI